MSSAGSTALPATHHRRWTVAIFFIFAAHGIGISSVMSRLPSIRDHLHVEASQVSLILLFFAVGGIGGLTTSSHVVHRFGSRMVNRVALCGIATMLALMGLAVVTLENVAVVIAIALVLGVNIGMGDVAMNVSGATIEHQTGKVWLPRFHGSFSLGTIVGAALGSLMSRLGVGIGWHFLGAAMVLAGIALIAPRAIPLEDEEEEPHERSKVSILSIWREPITIVIGLMTLAFAYAEGGAGDWLSIALVDGHGATEATGALVLGVFNTAMLTFRLLGTGLLARFGRMRVLVASAVVGAVGLSLFIFADPIWLVIVGVVFWGSGAALGFPTGMSAAADDPHTAAKRVSVVATLGYLGFIGGPVIVGFVADHTGFPNALLVVLGFFILAGLLTPGVRQRRSTAS